MKLFKRKTKLDVKARHQAAHAMRMRMAVSALAISAGLVLTLFSVWKGGEWLMDRYVYQNRAFALEHIHVETDGIIPIDQIRAWANARPGQNLLALDLGRIKRDLEMVPLIEAASVERVLPRRLIIRVSEREPIARVTVYQPREPGGLLESSTLYLDREGMVIPPILRALNTRAFDQATRDLPSITGFDPAQVRIGHKLPNRRVLAALDWIRAFRKSEMNGRVDARSIDVSSEMILTLHTDQGNEVTFSAGSFERQFARWRSVHALAMSQRKMISSLDLAVTNYVPTVWVDWTNTPPPVLQSNPSPYRKRNV